MYRHALKDLAAWKQRTRRKPLVIRGARQVGKTTLVRLFAEQCFENLALINLEREPEVARLFAANDLQRTLQLLQVHLGCQVVPGRTLLFIDEVQAAPQVLGILRYFYEDLPELHLIAAGSLLEQVLEAPPFPVPVGRIEYLHLGPMQFDEFLLAAGKNGLAGYLEAWNPGEEIPEAIHAQLVGLLRTFLVVGGMPEAVQAFVEGDSFRASEIVKASILATFRDDFGKYGPRADPVRLRKVFARLPYLVGKKLKYVHIDRDERSKDLAAALHRLALARVLYQVRHSAANGVPLGAEADDRKQKLLALDVGLMATASGLSILDLEGGAGELLVNRGALCEQLVGQHLLYSGPSWQEPELYYWAREKRNSAAEVDYVIAQGGCIVPVEVKAGKTGRLKSLHLFGREKSPSLAVRFNAEPPSILQPSTSPSDPQGVSFQLLSLPLYLAPFLRQLLGTLVTKAG